MDPQCRCVCKKPLHWYLNVLDWCVCCWSHFALQVLVALMVLMFDPTFFTTNWAEMSLLLARAPGCADPCKALITDYSLSWTPSIFRVGHHFSKQLKRKSPNSRGTASLVFKLDPLFYRRDSNLRLQLRCKSPNCEGLLVLSLTLIPR